jgi:hypothetical protein
VAGGDGRRKAEKDRKMKALKKCANGCDAPPQAPSKVLCKECLEKLDIRFRALARRWAPKGEEKKMKIFRKTEILSDGGIAYNLVLRTDERNNEIQGEIILSAIDKNATVELALAIKQAVDRFTVSRVDIEF